MRRQQSHDGYHTPQVSRLQQFQGNSGSCPNLSSINEDSEGFPIVTNSLASSSSTTSPQRQNPPRPRLQRSLSNNALDNLSSLHRMPQVKRNRSNSSTRHDMLPRMKSGFGSATAHLHDQQRHRKQRRKSDPGNGYMGVPMKSRQLPKSFFEEPTRRNQQSNSTGVHMEPLWAATIGDPSSPRSRTSIPSITKAANTEQLWKLFNVLEPGDRAKLERDRDLEKDEVLMSKFFELHFELNVPSNKLPVIDNSEFPSNFSETINAPLNTTEALNNFVMTL